MLDIKMILKEPERVRALLATKNEKCDIDAVISLDEQRKGIIAEAEKMKAEKNRASKAIGEAKKAGRSADADIEALRVTGDKIKELDDKLGAIDLELRQRLLEMPNLPHESTPDGKSSADNVVVREWGAERPKNFKLKNHIEIAESLDILDFKRGTKIAGSGFVLYKKGGAQLERALLNYFLDTNTKNGFTEVFPPFLVNPACAEGTGQLPKSRDQMYYVNEDDLFLIPTAEVPVTNIFRDEILGYKELPIHYTAYSACFRREAGSWGKDTRGFLRVHEFNKVEMVKFCEPERSYVEHETLVNCAEELLKGLGLKYRVLSLCKGDISFAAAKCYDLEVYAEGEGRWLEVSSCSNFEDFQARRANIRYRDHEGKVRFVHTLNGSGLATARIIVSILENYQLEDGTVEVPEVLRKYMGGLERIGA
ncbi:MAG: serine--tRNA ligase [Fibrobacteres bacterium]|nr:serine--tRNA ligase [Fibrobacterota bacterium]